MFNSVFIGLLISMPYWAYQWYNPAGSIHSFQQTAWDAPAWADTLTNIEAVSPTSIKMGMKIYMQQCTVCHGENGRGDGESGFGLSVPPGDLNDAYTRNESDGAIFWKISNGREPMPSFNIKLTTMQRWNVVNYIREIQRQGQKKK